MAEQDILHALKTQQWERAKGELRALAALHGTAPARYEPKSGAYIENGKWRECTEKVEEFIRYIEHNGLHE